MFEHSDTLARLNENISLRDKLDHVCAILQQRYPKIDRVAIALYEPSDDLLHTLVSSGSDALDHYEAKLADCGSLLEILERRAPRVIEDLSIFASGKQEHTQEIARAGFRSSYTLPMYLNGTFFGFVFFNSHAVEVFNDSVLHNLDVFGHLITLVIVSEVAAVRALLGAIRTAREMTHHRDAETGAHVDRMARYSRLIALELASKHGLDDETVHQIFTYAPLHDLGKIAIADQILLKPGRLTEDEYRLMKTHVDRGREMVDKMLETFGLEGFSHVDMLRNIVEYHHEALDGTGYPHGLKDQQIPIEARIVSVADVFDAMTSDRPYRKSRSNEQAFADLRRIAGTALDPECVEALIRRAPEIEEIQRQFEEDRLG